MHASVSASFRSAGLLLRQRLRRSRARPLSASRPSAMYSALAGIVSRTARVPPFVEHTILPHLSRRTDSKDKPRRFCRILLSSRLRLPRTVPVSGRRQLASLVARRVRRADAHDPAVAAADDGEAAVWPGSSRSATIRTTSSAFAHRDAVDRDDRVAADPHGLALVDTPRSRPGAAGPRTPAAPPVGRRRSARRASRRTRTSSRSPGSGPPS